MSDTDRDQLLEDRDRLTQSALLGISNIFADIAGRAMTQADHDRIVAASVIGYLLNNELITANDDPNEWLPVGLPSYLMPDIAAAEAKLQRYNDIARGA